MSKLVSIWRNRGTKDEIHMTVFLDEKDHKRLGEIAEEDLKVAEAYDKLVAEKDQSPLLTS